MKLLSALKASFEPREKLLTTAFGATSTYITRAYNMKAICKIIDFGMIMAYDFHEVCIPYFLLPLTIKIN